LLRKKSLRPVWAEGLLLSAWGRAFHGRLSLAQHHANMGGSMGASLGHHPSLATSLAASLALAWALRGYFFMSAMRSVRLCAWSARSLTARAASVMAWAVCCTTSLTEVMERLISSLAADCCSLAAAMALT